MWQIFRFDSSRYKLSERVLYRYPWKGCTVVSPARKLRTRWDTSKKKKKKKNQPGTRPIFAILPFRVSRFPLSDTTKRSLCATPRNFGPPISQTDQEIIYHANSPLRMSRLPSHYSNATSSLPFFTFPLFFSWFSLPRLITSARFLLFLSFFFFFFLISRLSSVSRLCQEKWKASQPEMVCS